MSEISRFIVIQTGAEKQIMVGPFPSRPEALRALYCHGFDPQIDPGKKSSFWVRNRDRAIAVLENNPSGMPATTKIISPLEWQVENQPPSGDPH